MTKILEPTQQSYHLRCKVEVKEVTYDDIQSKGSTQVTEKMVFLIPQEGTQRDTFLTAWLPESENELYELATLMGHPVNGPCRAAVVRKNKNCLEHHLFVMSVGVEKELLNMDGAIVSVEVLPENSEEVADHAKDHALPFEKKYQAGQTGVRQI